MLYSLVSTTVQWRTFGEDVLRETENTLTIFTPEMHKTPVNINKIL